jgi:alpha/beta superfamily hydrolase
MSSPGRDLEENPLPAVREDKLSIPGPAGALEVACREGSADGRFAGRGWCAVVCHPHPLHGGTMDNKVVTTLARAYGELGVDVTRFNFRGVGASAGVHDNGVGEVGDLRAVAAWSRERFAASQLLLAGFSFGCGVVSNACGQIPVAHALLVAPPVGRYNFRPVGGYPCPVCVVMGGRDELVDPAQVHAWAESLTPRPELIAMPDAGHFFHGQLVDLRQRLVATLARQLAGIP